MLDPVVEEFRRIREESARKFGYDAQAMARHLMRAQKNSGHPIVDRRAAKMAPPKSRSRRAPKAAA